MAMTITQLVDEAATRVEELNPIQCQRWIESRPNALVVDIREPNEYREGAIAGAILHLARSTGALIVATFATCIGMNIIAPDQYLSIIVPGRMFRQSAGK